MRLKPLNRDFSLRLQTLRLCRNGKLVMQSHSHIPSPAASGSQFPTLSYFLPLLSFIRVLLQFSYHYRQGRNLKYIHTWFWLPSSITCVQWNKRPKITGRVHRAGDNRIGTRQKTQMCRFHQKPSTHLPSREQKEATVQFLHLSLRFLDPKSRSQCCYFWTQGPQKWVLEIQKCSPRTVWIWWKSWSDKPTLSDS